MKYWNIWLSWLNESYWIRWNQEWNSQCNNTKLSLFGNLNATTLWLGEAQKKWYFLGMFPKPVDPPTYLKIFKNIPIFLVISYFLSASNFSIDVNEILFITQLWIWLWFLAINQLKYTEMVIIGELMSIWTHSRKVRRTHRIHKQL